MAPLVFGEAVRGVVDVAFDADQVERPHGRRVVRAEAVLRPVERRLGAVGRCGVALLAEPRRTGVPVAGEGRSAPRHGCAAAGTPACRSAGRTGSSAGSRRTRRPRSPVGCPGMTFLLFGPDSSCPRARSGRRAWPGWWLSIFQSRTAASWVLFFLPCGGSCGRIQASRLSLVMTVPSGIVRPIRPAESTPAARAARSGSGIRSGWQRVVRPPEGPHAGQVVVGDVAVPEEVARGLLDAAGAALDLEVVALARAGGLRVEPHARSTSGRPGLVQAGVVVVPRLVRRPGRTASGRRRRAGGRRGTARSRRG